jgi:hypothetical protein
MFCCAASRPPFYTVKHKAPFLAIKFINQTKTDAYENQDKRS